MLRMLFIGVLLISVLSACGRRATSPPGPDAWSSTRLARPPHTCLAIDMPSISTHVDEPVKGCVRRLTWVFHVPISKSKSWLISAVDIFSPCGTCSLSGLRYAPEGYWWAGLGTIPALFQGSGARFVGRLSNRWIGTRMSLHQAADSFNHSA